MMIKTVIYLDIAYPGFTFYAHIEKLLPFALRAGDVLAINGGEWKLAVKESVYCLVDEAFKVFVEDAWQGDSAGIEESVQENTEELTDLGWTIVE